MREIKFRGKRIDNGEWVFGDLLNCEDGSKKIVNSDDFYEVIPETVGQYTGLHDSKRTKEYPEGQDIYEGDIVHMIEVGKDFCREYITDIKWEDCCFCMKSEKMDDYDTFLGAWSGNLENTYPLFEMTVIGNIYDNPELLKESE